MTQEPNPALCLCVLIFFLIKFYCHMASLIHAMFSRAAFATTAESSSLNRAWVAHKDENVDNHALCRKGLPPPGLGCGQVRW